MKRLLQEPLLHFLVLGAGLFLAYALVSKPGGAPDEIVVTAGQVEHLAIGFAKTWQRPPSDEELKGLVDDWVREEIATREAMALGMDQGDAVIRRRLRQKLEFVSEDIVAQAEPTDADLAAYLRAHPESFRVEPVLTFDQVYLDPQRHGDHLARDAAQLLARLNQAGAETDLSALGDSLMLEPTFQSVPASEVGKQFGPEFAAALDDLPSGQWHGPVESGYGVHLVRIRERAAGGLPEFADVRDVVRREWENDRRLEANRRFYERLLERYTVRIESPPPAEAERAPAAR